MPCPFPNCDRFFMHASMRSHIAGHFLRGHRWAGQEGADRGAVCLWCGNTDGKCSTSVHSKKIDSKCNLAYYLLRLNSAATPTSMNPSTNLPIRRKVLDCRKWHCTYAMPHHMAQAHPVCPMTMPSAAKRRKERCCKPLTISGPHCHRRRSLLRRRPCPLFSLLFSLGQTGVVVVVAVLVAAAPPPMPPPVRVHPPAVVPRQALVTMSHRNPCLMGRQPAGSQHRKRPGQRSVLAPRVPARGHATSGRMIPMLEAPLLPSLLYIYVCGLLQGEGRARDEWEDDSDA